MALVVGEAGGVRGERVRVREHKPEEATIG
jgi:hypothetical protein